MQTGVLNKDRYIYTYRIAIHSTILHFAVVVHCTTSYEFSVAQFPLSHYLTSAKVHWYKKTWKLDLFQASQHFENCFSAYIKGMYFFNVKTRRINIDVRLGKPTFIIDSIKCKD